MSYNDDDDPNYMCSTTKLKYPANYLQPFITWVTFPAMFNPKVHPEHQCSQTIILQLINDLVAQQNQERRHQRVNPPNPIALDQPPRHLLSPLTATFSCYVVTICS